MGRFDSVLDRYSEREKKVSEFRQKVNDAAEQIRNGLSKIKNLRVAVTHEGPRNKWKSEIMAYIDSDDSEVLALESFKVDGNLGVDQIVESVLNAVLEKISK